MLGIYQFSWAISQAISTLQALNQRVLMSFLAGPKRDSLFNLK